MLEEDELEVEDVDELPPDFVSVDEDEVELPPEVEFPFELVLELELDLAPDPDVVAESAVVPREVGAGTLVLARVSFRADQVFGPTIPSTLNFSFLWKFLTAASVLGPKEPSTTPHENPSLFKAVCRVFTAKPDNPYRTVGVDVMMTEPVDAAVEMTVALEPE